MGPLVKFIFELLLLFPLIGLGAEPLFRIQDEEALRDLFSWFEGNENGKPRFSSQEYFVLGVGASPAVLVDMRNRLAPDSAAVLPFSGAAEAVRNYTRNVEMALSSNLDPESTQAKLAEWKADKKRSFASALPQHLRSQFAENVRAAIGDKLKGRKILLVDLTMEGHALIMAKENIQWLWPDLKVEALALDNMSSFIPPDPSYKVLRLNSGTLTRLESALSASKMYTGVPGWDVSTGQGADRFGRNRLSGLFAQKYQDWLGDMIISTPVLLDAHWRGVGCEGVFGARAKGASP